GLRFLAAVRLSERDPSISAVITSARYVVALSELALKERLDDAELARRVAAFLERREHRVRRDIGKIGKIIDVRQLTDSVAVGGEAAHAVLDRAGIVGRVVPLELALPIRQNGSAKVAEVVDAVLGETGFPHRAVRAALLASGKSPLLATAPRDDALRAVAER